MDFVTVADSKFYLMALFSAQQIAEHHPESHLWIYDMGLLEGQVWELEGEPNVTVVPWDAPLTHEEWLEKWKHLPGWYHHQGYIFWQKPYCLQHVLEETDKVAMLDADAFITGRFDELLDESFDLGVTLREEHERGESGVPLNIGVSFFLGERTINRAVVRAWIDLMNENSDQRIEQGAMGDLVAPSGVLKAPGKVGVISADGYIARVKSLPVTVYNNYHPERSTGKGAKVVHLKARNRVETTWEDLEASREMVA